MSDNNRNYILFDDLSRDRLLPFTFIRPVAEIRLGILTIREKWEMWLHSTTSALTKDYLQEKYPLVQGEVNVLINGAITPNADLVGEIEALKPGETLVKDSLLIAVCLDKSELADFDLTVPAGFVQKQASSTFLRINRPWHLFYYNGQELISDYELVTAGKISAPISSTNNLLRPDRIFAEEGVKLEYATLNASTGPIYLGRNTEIMEGALIRGPFALCEGAIVKMGAKIYGPTTLGPFSKVGGEVTNSILFAYSNKVHEGYMGNSALGEWCNIGADSNTSNLKNNYTRVKVWDYVTGRAEDTGLQFCGLMMGDYSKCGINTMFNTGTVVGISSNIYGAGFPGNFIPSFSWGGAAGFETYRVDKSFETIEKAMMSRNLTLSEADRRIIASVFKVTDRYRKSL
jgi:UDP-N-acetylglucosamine diphosphorylase/glucosamine-1-phosphate N-acetyltransferase